MQLCHQITHCDLGELIIKINICEKIKAANNKIKKNKAQYDLNRQTAKILVWSSGNVSKCKCLTHKDILPEKDLLEKAVIMKRFEYSPLGKELKGQTSAVGKQCQKLGSQIWSTVKVLLFANSATLINLLHFFLFTAK